jgi:hypothetical protein
LWNDLERVLNQITRQINKIIPKRPGQKQNAPQGTGLLSQSAVYHAPVPTAASSQTGFFRIIHHITHVADFFRKSPVKIKPLVNCG